MSDPETNSTSLRDRVNDARDDMEAAEEEVDGVPLISLVRLNRGDGSLDVIVPLGPRICVGEALLVRGVLMAASLPKTIRLRSDRLFALSRAPTALADVRLDRALPEDPLLADRRSSESRAVWSSS